MKEKLWGGRFKDNLDPLIMDFTKSIDYDWFLFEYELSANSAWINELARLGLISQGEKKSLIKAVKNIQDDYRSCKIKIDFKQEDIHSFFYDILRKKSVAGVDKIHAGKSRNEQIATLMRMFLKDAITEEIGLINNLENAILKKAKTYKDVLIPGFTHLQYAQPLLFAHWMLSFLEQLNRDVERLKDCFKRVDLLALGSGALAGSNFKINREKIKKELNFSALGKNSIDMVSDRDFIMEYLNANVILLLHLSRLSEDLIIYTSPGYDFISFSDKVTTGSSLMPHKKNPDPIEIIRSSAAEALSSYVFMSNLLKGLPTSYNRDLQLDKKALFSSYLVSTGAIEAMTVVIPEMSLKKENLVKILKESDFYVTDISEELIKKGLSWKEAHTRMGELVRYADEKKKSIKDLDRDIVKKILKKDIDLKKYIDPKRSVNAKASYGSTNPGFVIKELNSWTKILSRSRS